LLRAWNSYFAVTGEHENPPTPQSVGEPWSTNKIAAG
jgi:hypothetical protein